MTAPKDTPTGSEALFGIFPNLPTRPLSPIRYIASDLPRERAKYAPDRRTLAHIAETIGRRYGVVVVMEHVDHRPSRRQWRCACDCGNVEALLSSEQLLRGPSTCGPDCAFAAKEKRTVRASDLLGGRAR